MWVIHTDNKSSYESSFEINGKMKNIKCVNGDIETTDEVIIQHYQSMKCRVDFKEDVKPDKTPDPDTDKPIGTKKGTEVKDDESSS